MKKWRKARRLSQKALAERCKAAHTYIRQIESGIRTPSFSFIAKLADALEIDAYQLFYQESVIKLEDSSQMELLSAIKRDILTNVANGIDTVIIEARKTK